MSYIGADRNAAIAAASMNLPHSLFMPPVPPPQHYYNNQVVNEQGFTLNNFITYTPYIIRYLMYLDQVPLLLTLSTARPVKLVLLLTTCI